jgi:hypothetical protein
MTGENRKWESFGKDIGRHVCSRYPGSRERTVLYVIANKMMADIDMFGTRRYRRRV